jgi:flagellin-like protein
LKRNWIVRKDSEAVSPVIATILMVAITVVLAAVLYVMVLGFGGTSTQAPTTSLAKKVPGPSYGVKYEFVAISKDTSWDDISILLSDGTNSQVYHPAKANMSGGITVTKPMGSTTWGTVRIWCNLTDLVGNGNVNGGDYFTFTTGSGSTLVFSPSLTYTISILYDPTSEKIFDTTFSG